MKALIALEDGRVFEGSSFTGAGEAVGELVFNTSMAGYQEVLTDPSYYGQMVVMTYPLIGNYGVNEEDMESDAVHPRAFLMREYQAHPSNFRSRGSLADFLQQHKILGIEGLDTRAITRHIRTGGAMKAIISTTDLEPASLVRRAREWEGMGGVDTVQCVSCREHYGWDTSGRLAGDKVFAAAPRGGGSPLRVVALDCGIKFNQLRILADLGCLVQVLPASATAAQILALEPDGVFLSNGPGDPAGLPQIVDNVRALLGRKPVFGICLGHQILGLAYGGTTYKLKFGHRGVNQPVKNLLNGRVEITSQNHGYCVDPASLDPAAVEVTHINLNDGSLEGMRHRRFPSFSVQYHPEHAPGPHDAVYLFRQFIELMRTTGA